MGKLKSIKFKLQLYLVLLLLSVIILADAAAVHNMILPVSPVLLVLGALGIRLIVKHLTQPVDTYENQMEARINERTDALDASTNNLKEALDELKFTQQQIIHTETQKSLTSIVSGFGHEINNPLTGILGYIDLMEMNDSLPEKSKKRLENIKDQAIRIKEIIDHLNMLDPEIEQIKSEINLPNLLEKLIKIIKKGNTASGITVETVFHQPEILVCGNHFALWQVYEGIIENAVEAINEHNIKNGTIRVETSLCPDGETVITHVTDNGGGFACAEKAFNPFYTTKCRTRKRGIGLSIAFNLVLEHKGTIRIKNNPQGATVSVLLPCCKDVQETVDAVANMTKTDSLIQHKKTMSGG